MKFCRINAAGYILCYDKCDGTLWLCYGRCGLGYENRVTATLNKTPYLPMLERVSIPECYIIWRLMQWLREIWMSNCVWKCADTYEMKVQVSVARYLRTPPYTAKCKELSFDCSNCLRSQSHRSTIVICNCTFYADNGGSLPGKS